MKKRILLVEDSPSLSMVYQSYLASEDYLVITVETGRDAMIQILRSPPDVILLDLKLPDMDGMSILDRINADQIPSAVIIITAHGSVDIAVASMQKHAFDFLVKPFDAKRLTVTVRNALSHLQLSQEVKTYRETFARESYEGFIGESLPMQAIYRFIDSAAPSNATVFITGESGTGKEVCASAIHQRSSRAQQPFIALNCGAIPRDLMESEIFGHVKGAFTGAQSAREGAATQADGGTLFLDEICEMDLDLQTKLLRFIQTGTFQRVGGSKNETVNIRFLCATNRDPVAEVKGGRFREDLFYRLHVLPIQLPALRHRETDIKLLMDHFLSKYNTEEHKSFKRFSADVTKIMMSYAWPGNIRQLQNSIRNIVVLNNAEVVTIDMLPPPLNGITESSFAPKTSDAISLQSPYAPLTPTSAKANSDPIKPLWLTEKEAIERAIDLCDGNIPKAAALLEVSASTIYRKKEKW